MLDKSKLAELSGIIIGDGCISVTARYHELAISGDLVEEFDYYVNHVAKLLNNAISGLRKPPLEVKKYPSLGVCGIITFDETIVKFIMKTLALAKSSEDKRVPNWIMKSDDDVIKSFLRGFGDADGSVFFQKHYGNTSEYRKTHHTRPRIKLSTVNLGLRKDVIELLHKIGIQYWNKRPYKGRRDKNPVLEIYVDRKNDVELWLDEIGFSNSKHTTKVEVWKKFGFCPPNTTFAQRLALLKQKS